jgi:hypothetical protein
MEEQSMPKPAKGPMNYSKSPKGPQISQDQARKYLAKAPEENVFWCNNGTVIRDLKELKESLTGMSDQTFAYHHNEIKKDFANWIKYVLGDEKLATDLENTTNRQKAAQAVEERYSLLIKAAG